MEPDTARHEPYMELSFFASLVAITLSFVFYEARQGFTYDMNAHILKALGCSLLFVNAPAIICTRFSALSKQRTWHDSYAFVTLSVVSTVLFIGFMISENRLRADVVVPVFGFLAFVFIVIRYITFIIAYKFYIRSAILSCLFLVFSVWVASSVWGAGNPIQSHYLRYFSPFFTESIPLGGAHLDTLFHCSISNMILTYGIPSTGLDGLPFLNYHFGSHWIFAMLSKVLQIDMLLFYNLCYPVIFLPFFFYSMLLLMIELRMFYPPSGPSKLILLNSAAFLIFLFAFVSFLPEQIFDVEHIGASFASQTYIVSLACNFLLFCLCLKFWDVLKKVRTIQGVDLLFLMIIVPLLVGCIGILKASTMFLMFAAISYLMIRLSLYKYFYCNLSYLITAVFVLIVCYYVTPRYGKEISFEFLHYIRHYISPYRSPYNFLFHYFWALLLMVFTFVQLKPVSRESIHRGIKGKKTVACEVLMLLSIAGFLPGAFMNIPGGSALYFFDYQQWIAVPILMAAFHCLQFKKKSLQVSVVLLLIPLLYVVYSNMENTFMQYRRYIAVMKGQILHAPKQVFAFVNLLLQVGSLPPHEKKQALLFIPQDLYEYWNIGHSITCFAVPFVAPALSGMALLDGLPSFTCDVPQGYGYSSYLLRTREQLPQDTTNSMLCDKALKMGFERVIKIDRSESGLESWWLKCDRYYSAGEAGRGLPETPAETRGTKQVDTGERKENYEDVQESSRLGTHWIEAEHANTITSPLEVAVDENASGGKYMYAPNRAGNLYTPGMIMATYPVKIMREGTYVLWGRVKVSDKRDNSFFVQIDDGGDNIWEVEAGDHWHWDAINDRNGEDPVKFTLTEGLHTIKIKLREDGTKLDKMVLTNDESFIPSGNGAPLENQGNREVH